MSYIGNTVQNQNYVPAVDYFNGDGSTVAFTLSRPVASVAAVQAVISNVPQNPGSAFTVSGSTITFTSAPPSGTNNIYVYYTSPNTQVVQPGQGTVYPSSLSTGGPTWDASGNLGVGVTPSAWSLGRAAEINTVGQGVWATSTAAVLVNNNYYNGGYKFAGTGYASRVLLSGQTQSIDVSNASGTAGNAITFASVLATGYNQTTALQGATQSSGTGIAFPATQSASSDANTLDDYEEGTWTPVMDVNSGTPTFTYNSRGGQYVKIGRFVWAYFYMDINVTVAAGSLAALVPSSLPFPPASVSNSIYTSGGFVTRVPSAASGVTVLLANNADFASASELYFQNTINNASYTFTSGVYAGYLVYQCNS